MEGNEHWEEADSGPGEGGALQGVGGGSRATLYVLVGSFHRTNWEWFVSFGFLIPQFTQENMSH